MRGRKFAAPAGTGLRAGIDIVDDGIFLRRFKVRRLEHQAIKVSLAVAPFHLDGDWRNPSIGYQLRNILLAKLHLRLTIAVPQHSSHWFGRRGIRVNKIVPVGGNFDAVIGVLGGEQTEPAAVEVNAVEMFEERFAIGLFAHSHEVNNPVLLVNEQNLSHIPFAVRDLILELAGGEVVEIKIAPVIALAEPENLV